MPLTWDFNRGMLISKNATERGRYFVLGKAGRNLASDFKAQRFIFFQCLGGDQVLRNLTKCTQIEVEPE